MAPMKKRYRLSLDFEIEVKEFTDVPVPRGEWSDDTSPQYIIVRMKCVRELLATMLENPEVLNAYLRYRVLEKLEAEGISVEEMAGKMGMEADENEILKPLLEELPPEAVVHFVDADWNEDAYSASVPLFDAFKGKMVGARMEEIGE